MSFFKQHISKFNDNINKSHIDRYKQLIENLNKIDLSLFEDEYLKQMSKELKSQARNGVPLEELIIKAYALVKEAAHRVLGIYPYDVQLMAGIAMHDGKLAEMQTGEGKTLAAVFPAYLNALQGKGVHILTFNDYLAQRDAEWMGPIYKFLGLEVGFIKEGMGFEKRKNAYASDITYMTAKEAGFDYLRDCLCYEREYLVQRPFTFAIVDEADSILIDEARIPLVIAGSVSEKQEDVYRIASVIAELQPGEDFNTDDYKRNVFLTDSGLSKIEAMLNCHNLYLENNYGLLTAVNSALHARVLLKKNVDYIVRNGRVELVDEFTGRVADKRHWPDGLQAAIEAKEGLKLQTQGRIMGSITLQNFMKLYPKISGMTATAVPSSKEIQEFYGLEVEVIPPNRPCIRIDHSDLVFTHKEAKYNAIVEEVTSVHATGRPILIGTASIAESDMLAHMLAQEGVNCVVLNAKNDEEEAKIIANAGKLGAVTVSTNMAGRGTDIKLGGECEKERQSVISLGGLYILGTNRHESRRIDNQLRGRAGRQGDPGCSRFFVSLEDDLIKRYGIDMAIPPQYRDIRQTMPLEKPVVRRMIAHIQRVMEGQNFDIRRTLWKYSNILEEQRRIVQKWRLSILLDTDNISIVSDSRPEKYRELLSILTYDQLKAIERHITLYHIDKCWADHLDFVAYVREGIHLVSICGQSPLDEFHKAIINAFINFKSSVEEAVIRTINSLKVSGEGIDLESEGLKGPSSTWTYLVTDDYFINNLGTQLITVGNSGFAAAAALTSWPILLWTLIYERFMKGKKRE